MLFIRFRFCLCLVYFFSVHFPFFRGSNLHVEMIRLMSAIVVRTLIVATCHFYNAQVYVNVCVLLFELVNAQ